MYHAPMIQIRHVQVPAYSSGRRRHGHRTPRSRRDHYHEEYEDDEDDEEDDSDSDRSIMSEIYDGASAASRLGNMYGGRMPGFGPWNGHHHGMGHIGHHQPHGHRHPMYPGGMPFHGHRGDRVAGMFERDPYRIGHGYESSEISY